MPAPVPCGSGVSPCRGLGQSCAFPTGFPGPTGVAGPSPRPAPSPRASVSPPPLPPFRVWKALSAPLHEWPELCRGRGEDGGPSAGPQSSHWRPHPPQQGAGGSGWPPAFRTMAQPRPLVDAWRYCLAALWADWGLSGWMALGMRKAWGTPCRPDLGPSLPGDPPWPSRPSHACSGSRGRVRAGGGGSGGG